MQIVERVDHLGAAGAMYDRYRVAAYFVGAVGNPNSQLSVVMWIATTAADDRVPDDLVVSLRLESDTLPTRVVTIRVVGDVAAPDARVLPVRKRDVVGLELQNVYGVGRGEPAFYLPVGKHTARAALALDGREAIPLPGVLHTRIHDRG